MSSGDIYLCHQCGKIFFKLSTLESHTKWKHMEKTNDFMCEQCGRTFHKKFNLHKHLESGVHFISETVKCALCDFKALNRKIMCEHYENFHGVFLKHSNIYFKSADEFFLWKTEFENDTRSRFVKMSSSRRRKNGFLRSTYFCHRDGNFIPKGKHLRHLKLKGSNKINCHCPAKIDVDMGENLVIVSYVDTHLGHEQDVTRLGLTRLDKALIAEKLALQVPFETILEEMNGAQSKHNVRRSNLLTRKDLWNIVDTFKINPKTVVYSKSRARRKRSIVDKPKKESKRRCTYSKQSVVENKITDNSNDEQQLVIKTEVEEDIQVDAEVLSLGDVDGENIVLCPIIVKNESGDYIQEYAVLSGENDIGANTCLFINDNNNLETLEEDQVIYTEEEYAVSNIQDLDNNNLDGCPTPSADFEQAGNISEDVCNVLKDKEQIQTDEEPVMIIAQTPDAESEVIPTICNVENSQAESFMKNRLKRSNSRAYLTSNQKVDCEITVIEENLEVGDVIPDVENQMDIVKDNVDHVTKTFDSETTEDCNIQNWLGPEGESCEVALDNLGDGNEYVIISTSDDGLNEYTVIATENESDSQEDFTQDLFGATIIEEMREESVVSEEVVVGEAIEEECDLSDNIEVNWSEKRQKVLNKLLNVHSMISSEEQLEVFTNKLSSLECTLKSLSKT